MIGIFGSRWEKGNAVERIDTGEPGTIIGDWFGDYISVRWSDGRTSWTSRSLLRLVKVQMT